MNKLYSIIISDAGEITVDEVLSKLALSNLQNIGTKDFYDAQFISKGIGIGKYEDKVIIVEDSKVFDFLLEEIGSFEKNVYSIFPESTISVFYSYSVADIYGFSIINNSKRERTLYTIENKTLTDIGGKLDVEYINQDLGMSDLIDFMLYKIFGGEQVLDNISIGIYG